MNVRQLTASGVLLGATALTLGLSTPAYAVCDAYSGNCPTAPPAGAGAAPSTVTTQNPATLPFTGGELVLLSAVGAAALAGGTALVVAGRRKSAPDA